jgi:hypothetical protein
MVGHDARLRRCVVGRLIDQADADDRERITEWLYADGRETGMTDARLAKRLRTTGRIVSRSAIAAHRVDECCCEGLIETETTE